jgi:biotin operon repressor
MINVQILIVSDLKSKPKLADVPRTAPALLYEMMRSFVGLARTLNLSQAVEELGSTRQTVRRHIAQLEDSMGCRLFEVEQRRYALTADGINALGPAQMLLDQGSVWHAGQFQHVGGMMRFSFQNDTGWLYNQQQVPVSVAWEGRSDLLRAAIKAWSASEGQLESRHMVQVRPYVLAYRENSEGWICTEVGEKSFYSNWYGWAQARSSVGRNLSDFQGGPQFASLADRPYKEINGTHGLRLDQMMIQTRGQEDGAITSVVCDRLLMGVRMPDGSPAIISVVDRASKMYITGISDDVIERIPDKARVEFAP